MFFRQIPAWLALIGTLCFIGLAGIEGPSMRAGIAALVVVLANTFERTAGMLNSIVVAYLVLILIWPGSFLDPGVQLTFAALLGISTALQQKNSDTVFLSYLRVCFYASLFTAPIVLFWFGYFSLIGLICNPIFAPIVSILGCKLGFLALFLCWSGVDTDGIVLNLVSTLLYYNANLISFLAEFKYAGWDISENIRPFVVLVSIFPSLYFVKKSIKTYKSQYNLR